MVVDEEFSFKTLSINYRSSTISSSNETDDFQRRIGIPPPTMFFGNNFLQFTLSTADSTHKFIFTFNTIDALKLVSSNDTGMRVWNSHEWQSSRNISDEAMAKPFDWTYTTDYAGTCTRHNGLEAEWSHTPTATIDYQLLTQPERILFYKRIVLFEDELSDNGISLLTLRIRVMPSCFLVLLQFYLRVEGVLFRVWETRYFHKFGSSVVVRERSCKESSFDYLKSNQQVFLDPSLLMNADWVSSKLPVKSKSCETLTINL